MKYCIIIPKYTDFFDQAYFFPIGIAYVASSLRASGRDVISLNLNYKEGTTYELLKNFLSEHHVDVVATGGITSYYRQLHDIFKTVKKIKPDIITCCGGGIITSAPEDGMKALELVDYGIIGEGESTICEWAEALEKNSDMGGVCGLIYRENQNNGKFHITAPRAECMDLDALPYPDYEGFEYDKLLLRTVGLDLYAGNSERLGAVSFSRSCPFNCTFCFHPSGTKYRRRSMESIFQEIDYLIERFDVKNIVIMDELFFAGNLTEIERFCKKIKKRNIGYAISLRVDKVNIETLKILKESGCFEIGFGIESADNSVLKSMRKHITVEQIERALKICYDIGLNFQGNFIFGDQAENWETAHNTISWWENHPEYNISLHMIVTYPGSVLYNVARQRGIIKDGVQFIKQGCPLVNVSKLSDDEYKELSILISMLPRKDVHALQDVSLRYSGRGKVDFAGRCPQCGTKNLWEGLDVFRNLASQICVECNKSIFINVSRYGIPMLRKNYSRLRDKGIRFAFWPMASSVGEIIYAIPDILEDDMVYLIDSAKCGVAYKGKTIYEPKILQTQDIKVVFLTVTTPVSQEITTILRTEYPFVKCIYFAGDLMDDKFDIDAIIEKTKD